MLVKWFEKNAFGTRSFGNTGRMWPAARFLRQLLNTLPLLTFLMFLQRKIWYYHVVFNMYRKCMSTLRDVA